MDGTEPRRVPRGYVAVGTVVCIAATAVGSFALYVACDLDETGQHETFCDVAEPVWVVSLLAAIFVPLIVGERSRSTRLFAGICAAIVLWASLELAAALVIG